MDVTIEATPMTAGVVMLEAVIKVVRCVIHKAMTHIESVVSISRPSIGGTSLSAVSPDAHTKRGTSAVAV